MLTSTTRGLLDLQRGGKNHGRVLRLKGSAPKNLQKPLSVEGQVADRAANRNSEAYCAKPWAIGRVCDLLIRSASCL